ncbi:MAG: prepilin peptidase [Candidatus Thorarchaeota archaeon]
MALELTIVTIMSFLITSLLLLVYSWMDFKDRKVQNQAMLVGFVIGISSIIVSGHFLERIELHVIAGVFVCILSYILFRLKSIGGADFKSLITIAIISPGIEFTTWESPLYEAIIGAGLQIGIMLFLGYMIWKRSAREENEARRPTPLIPLLLVAYFVVQLLAFI